MLRTLFATVCSLAVWVFLVLSSVVLFPIAALIWLVTVPFDPRLRHLHLFTCFWGSIYTWLNPAWPVTLSGLEKIDPRRTYVMVANHQSLLDILVLFRLFVHFKWVSKAENFHIPLIGWNMTLNRYIRLKRGDKESILTMLRDSRRALRARNSVMMFPEGTRSADGRLRAFKTGAFQIAQQTQRAILPIVVDGTSDALPKRGLVMRGRHRITVRVLDPLPYSEFADETVDSLTLRVRDLIAKHLGDAKPGDPQPPGA